MNASTIRNVTDNRDGFISDVSSIALDKSMIRNRCRCIPRRTVPDSFVFRLRSKNKRDPNKLLLVLRCVPLFLSLSLNYRCLERPRLVFLQNVPCALVVLFPHAPIVLLFLPKEVHLFVVHRLHGALLAQSQDFWESSSSRHG